MNQSQIVKNLEEALPTEKYQAKVKEREENVKKRERREMLRVCEDCNAARLNPVMMV